MRSVQLANFDGSSLNRGRPKIIEIAWWLTKLTFIQSPFPWPSSFKVRLLRAFGSRVGSGVYIRPGVNIHFPWKLSIGNNSWIGERTTILNLDPITIEDDVAIAHEVYITSGGHDIRSSTFAYKNGPVAIQPGAWIASRAFIGPHVLVGTHAVVAAGAVVIHNVEPWSIVGGTPARQIGVRSLDDPAHRSEHN